MRYQKRRLTLPDTVVREFAGIRDTDLRDTYIREIRAAGWTLQSISEAAGLTRERIRQIANMPVGPGTSGLLVPMPPIVEEPEAEAAAPILEPTPEVLERLRALHVVARKVRAHSPEGREEAEQFTELLWKLIQNDVTIRTLSKRLGLTGAAIRGRLVRYGYLESANGKSRAYKPIIPENRIR